MTYFDELGLKAAERLEASVGPFIALASYKRLYAAEPHIRGKAALGGLRCAIALGEDVEIENAIAVVRTLDADAPPAVGHAIDLLRSGKAELARALAEAEEARTGSVLAAYARARAEEAARTTPIDATALWEGVVSRALAAEEIEIHTHAVSRWVAAWLARARKDPTASLPRAALATACERAHLDGASPEEQLLILRGRLLSPSNFHRASAASVLEEISRRQYTEGGVAAVGAMAVAMACRHFDEMPFHIPPVEMDRIRACLKRLPHGPSKEALQARLDATVESVRIASRGAEAEIEGAIAALSRGSELTRGASVALRGSQSLEGHSIDLGSGPFERATGLSIEATIALRRHDEAAAESALVRARNLLSPDVAVPIPMWTVAATALAARSPTLKRAAAALVSAAFRRTTSLPPPPLVGLAARLAGAGAHDVAVIVLDEAARFKEPEAQARAADARRRLAYEALARGDRAAALTSLADARRLFDASDRVGPPRSPAS